MSLLVCASSNPTYPIRKSGGVRRGYAFTEVKEEQLRVALQRKVLRLLYAFTLALSQSPRDGSDLQRGQSA